MEPSVPTSETEPISGTTAPAVRQRPFPVTTALVVLYLPLALWPSLYDGNDQRLFVWEVTLVALVVTFATELVLRPLPTQRGHRKHIHVGRAGTIALIGSAVLLVGSQLGLGVYGYGLSTGLKTASHLTTLLTPLQAWPYVGILLCFYAWRDQPEDRRLILVITGGSVLLTTVTIYITSATGPLFELLFVLGISAVLAGIVKARWLVVGVVVVFLTWPLLYTIRNEGRLAKGTVSYANVTQTADTRLELDQSMALARMARNDGVQIPNLAGPLLILRTGLLPRAMDPHRPALQTSTDINIALGGNGMSSATFTTLGEIWFLYGWWGLGAVSAGVACLTWFLRRQRGPFAFCLIGGVLLNLVWAEQAFPDAIAATLQYLVSAVAAFILLWPARQRAPGRNLPRSTISGRTTPPRRTRGALP